MGIKWISLLTLLVFSGLNIHPTTEKHMDKEKYYCEYCGHKFPSVRLLTSGTCPRHPDGSNKGGTSCMRVPKNQNIPASTAASSFLPSR